MINYATKYILSILSVVILVGCQEGYRYPCQDPEKRHLHECKPEICKETRTCPKILP
jgi:hypothetical protein